MYKLLEKTKYSSNLVQSCQMNNDLQFSFNDLFSLSIIVASDTAVAFYTE